MKKIWLVILCIILIFTLGTTVYAADAVENLQEFKDLDDTDGGGKYIQNSEYYYLDLVEVGLFDSGVELLNSLANVIFTLEVWIAKITCTLIFYAETVSIADLVGEQMNMMQNDLKTQLFDPMFALVFTFTCAFIAWLFMKRNMQAIINQFLKVFFTILGVSIIATHSVTAINTIDELTSEMSNAIVSSVAGEENTGNNYGVTMAANLWDTLIHQPWKTLEFGKKMSGNEEEKINALLTNHVPISKDTKEYVKTLVGNDKDNPLYFGKEMALQRLGLTTVYLLPLTGKCVIYGAIAVLKLSYRAIIVLLFAIGIIIFMFSLIPQLGDTALIVKWLKKIIEMPIMIIILSFVMGFLILIDKLLYSQVNNVGWLIIILTQFLLEVVIFLYRDKILGFFETVQGAVRNPQEFIAMASQAATRIGDRAKDAIDGTGDVMGAASNYNRTASDKLYTTLNNIKNNRGSEDISDYGTEFNGYVNEPIDFDDTQKLQEAPRPQLFSNTAMDTSDRQIAQNQSITRHAANDSEAVPKTEMPQRIPRLSDRAAENENVDEDQQEPTTPRPLLVGGHHSTTNLNVDDYSVPNIVRPTLMSDHTSYNNTNEDSYSSDVGEKLELDDEPVNYSGGHHSTINLNVDDYSVPNIVRPTLMSDHTNYNNTNEDSYSSDVGAKLELDDEPVNYSGRAVSLYDTNDDTQPMLTAELVGYDDKQQSNYIAQPQMGEVPRLQVSDEQTTSPLIASATSSSSSYIQHHEITSANLNEVESKKPQASTRPKKTPKKQQDVLLEMNTDNHSKANTEAAKPISAHAMDLDVNEVHEVSQVQQPQAKRPSLLATQEVIQVETDTQEINKHTIPLQTGFEQPESEEVVIITPTEMMSNAIN